MPQGAATADVIVIRGGHKGRPEHDKNRTDLVIDPSSTEESVFHAFAGHRFQLGLAVGSIIAELVSTGRSNLPIAPFRIDRFTRAPAQTAP